MRRFLVIGGVFLLGIGTSQLVSFLFFPQIYTPSVRQSAVTTEATSTSALSLANSSERAIVTRVIDGDTIELTDRRRVRYIGIDTPETVDPRRPVECFGREAAGENRNLVEGKEVRLEKDISDVDRYGRLLRYVYVDDQMINEVLVRGGFAHASTFPPDVKYQDQFRNVEREARDNNRGLWEGCTLTNPTNLTNDSKKETQSEGCIVKGNISSSGEKIYHLPGCGSYDKTSIDESKGERWFCSEDEAQKAGWRKARNC